MAFTFEQLYKRYLKTEIDTFTSSAYNTVVSNDINVMLNGRGQPKTLTNLFVIMESGNGVQSRLDGHKLVSQQMIIYFYVPQNDTQTFLQQLTTFILTKNLVDRTDFYLDGADILYTTGGTGKTLTYSFNCLFNTPNVSPNKIDLGLSNEYQEIIVRGTITYDTLAIKLYDDMTFQFYVSSAYKTINNIVSDSETTALLGESAIYGTSQNTTQLYSGNNQTINLTVNFDSSDVNHLLLKRYSFMPQASIPIRITDNETLYRYDFTGYMRVSGVKTQGANRVLNVQIIVSGAVTETYTGV